MPARYLMPAALLLLAACSDSDDPPAADPGVDTATAPANERFLADNAARGGVTVTASGLQYEVLRAADGPMPAANSQVTVSYTGTLIDGTIFDSSFGRDEPSTFALDGTIPGFGEGVQLMSVGSEYRFVLPPELGYGDAGAGTTIPPDTVLIFVVGLLEINSM